MQLKEKFDYFLIPYERHTLYTKLKESEMEKKFHNRTATPAPSSLTHLIYSIPEEYEGEFFTNCFYLQGTTRNRDSLVIAYGVIQEEDTITKIQLDIQLMSPFNIAFPILLLISCIVSISVFIDIGFQKKALILTLFLLLIFMLFVFLFRFKSAAILYDLKKMFEADKTPN